MLKWNNSNRPIDIPDLNGKTIGLFWNGKPNGDVFLNRLAERLKAGFNGLTVVRMWDVLPETRTALGNSMDNLSYMARKSRSDSWRFRRLRVVYVVVYP